MRYIPNCFSGGLPDRRTVRTDMEDSYEYHVRVDWSEGAIGEMSIEGKPKVTIGPPPEFRGPEGVITPEDLFVAAATACHMTTFVAFARKMRFEFKSLTCEGTGILERVDKGFQFTKLIMRSTVVVASEELRAKAMRALELTGKYCLVTNSMKCETVHEDSVIVE